MKNITLFIISILSLVLLTPIALLHAATKGKNNFMDYAISIDQSINSLCGELLSDLFLKDKEINRFGDMDKTISYNLGKNKAAQNLNKFALLVCFLLHCIDKNHVEKAFEGDV